jgi:nitrite reductase/ring-hydroxylating ferredoxin subunit
VTGAPAPADRARIPIGAGRADWRQRPHAPAAGTRLCGIDEIPADDGREIVFGSDPHAFRLVLFRVEDGVRGYVNECPHQSVRLDFGDVFCVYDVDGRRDLMCPHHSALFHLDDGVCHEGPCVGARLIAVDVVVERGVAMIGGGARTG